MVGGPPIIHGTTAGFSDEDSFWMSRALAEAARGLGHVEPNPMVGAVIVRDGRLISVGHHRKFGGPHAEVEALSRAGVDARGSTLYVTLEPCCHFGKTPPCADAVVGAGVIRVVAAMRDPFPRVAGGGFARLRSAGIQVEIGLLSPETIRLNGPFFKRVLTGLPYVTAKWAMTLDGKIATADGDSRWISGPASRLRVHELRGRVDAIVIGIGTALADDPELTARPPGPRTPARVVLDSQALLPPTGRLARSAREIPVIVGVTDRAPSDRRSSLIDAGCEVIEFGGMGSVPILALLKTLGDRGMTNLLVEGGGRVIGSFFDAGQIDELDAYLAPILEGGEHGRGPMLGRGSALMSEARRLVDCRYEILDGDVRIRGTLSAPWRNSAELDPTQGPTISSIKATNAVDR
ncbi:bifunctional diaminohydroxyphosphoribosylaminopyrimidine deaminase/5-amino-6-(5-phosphoribosylamino)uracil reductase RibD [Isosphaeraceae bacterium EP7]